MVRFTLFALSFWITEAAQADSIYTAVRSVNQKQSRKLSAPKIAGYQPESSVTDHNALDLDQAALEEFLGTATPDFEAARAIYEKGGNSKSYAEITLDENLTTKLIKKTAVVGTNESGKRVEGKLYADADKDSNILKVQYSTSENQETYVNCRVGELPADKHITDGCLAADNVVKISDKEYDYTYDVTKGTKNGRTLQGFSRQVEAKMIKYDFPDATMFKTYYGFSDYGDQWVTAAFDGAATQFTNGNADFSKYGNSGKIEAIKKGIVFMNVFMYVIREFEDAVKDCETECDVSKSCNDDPVHAWDEGVAFYTGSLEGIGGSKDEGKFLHNLADKRCANFKTCGEDGNSSDKGEGAHVNIALFDLFNRGKDFLLKGKCEDVKPILKGITTHMYIPLIQGALRYAYKVGVQAGTEKSKAEGAVFAASVLPRIYNEDEAAAKTIYDNMKVGASETDHAAVKKAFESVYDDIGITCEQVGGLLTDDSKSYFAGAEPCSTSSGYTIGGAMTVLFGTMAVFLTSI